MSDLLFHPDRMIGGLRGVVYTEVVQTVVLVVGAVLVLLFGLHEVGGISEFKARLPDSYFHMIRPASDPVLGPLCCGRAAREWWPCAETTHAYRSFLGRASSRAIRSLPSGIGARTRSSCSACWLPSPSAMPALVRTLPINPPSRALALIFIFAKGTILASFFKLLPLFLLVIPGMVHFCFCCFFVVRFC